METFIVKAARMGGQVQEIAGVNGQTIEAVAEAIGIRALQGYKIKLNGSDVTPGAILTGPSTVVFVPRIKGGQDAITVKVAKMGSSMVEVVVAKGSTVRNILAAAQISDTANMKLKLDDRDVTLDTTVRTDGSRLILVPQIKGGQDAITVKVAKMGSSMVEVVVASGSTVRNILAAAQISDTANMKLKLNDRDVTLDTAVSTDGSRLILVPQIKGGYLQ